MSLEYCFRCGDPTGRAGRGDDSIYIGDEGPFCEECYAKTKRLETAIRSAIANIKKSLDTGWSIHAEDAMNELKEALGDK